MTGRVNGSAGHLANADLVAFPEQGVELAAVALELRARIEDLAEHVLHDRDIGADGDLAAKLLLEIGRRRQMIGMNVRLEQPLHVEAAFFHERDDLVSGFRGCPARRSVIIEHAVDNRGHIRRWILEHVACGIGRLVKKREHLWVEHRNLRRVPARAFPSI